MLHSKYIKGRAIAYGSLCRIVVRHHAPYPQPLLTHFYNTINNGLFMPPIGGIDLSWGIVSIFLFFPLFSLKGADL